MITWLLSWLFPLWALLPRARAIGAVTFQEVAGVGWQCTIRPPHGPRRSAAASRLNCWTGHGSSLGAALRDALAGTETQRADHKPGVFAPKLGGAEFDDE